MRSLKVYDNVPTLRLRSFYNAIMLLLLNMKSLPIEFIFYLFILLNAHRFIYADVNSNGIFTIFKSMNYLLFTMNDIWWAMIYCTNFSVNIYSLLLLQTYPFISDSIYDPSNTTYVTFEKKCTNIGLSHKFNVFDRVIRAICPT